MREETILILLMGLFLLLLFLVGIVSDAVATAMLLGETGGEFVQSPRPRSRTS
ncbi:hypothetical protein [Haladaptatus sp. NG-WS-4]